MGDKLSNLSLSELVTGPQKKELSNEEINAFLGVKETSLVDPDIPLKTDEDINRFLTGKVKTKPSAAATGTIEIINKYLAKPASRVAGIAFGVASTPAAFTLGAMGAPYEGITPEEREKYGTTKKFAEVDLFTQLQMRFRGAAKQVWRNATEEGYFASYDSVYKDIAGETIYESTLRLMPNSPVTAQYISIGFSILGNLATDPSLLAYGALSQISKFAKMYPGIAMRHLMPSEKVAVQMARDFADFLDEGRKETAQEIWDAMNRVSSSGRKQQAEFAARVGKKMGYRGEGTFQQYLDSLRGEEAMRQAAEPTEAFRVAQETLQGRVNIMTGPRGTYWDLVDGLAKAERENPTIPITEKPFEDAAVLIGESPAAANLSAIEARVAIERTNEILSRAPFTWSADDKIFLDHYRRLPGPTIEVTGGYMGPRPKAAVVAGDKIVTKEKGVKPSEKIKKVVPAPKPKKIVEQVAETKPELDTEALSVWEDDFRDIAVKTRLAEKTPGRKMSPEEVALNKADWEGYSRSRGYTEPEIEDYRNMIAMVEEGQKLGLTLGEIQAIEEDALATHKATVAARKAAATKVGVKGVSAPAKVTYTKEEFKRIAQKFQREGSVTPEERNILVAEIGEDKVKAAEARVAAKAAPVGAPVAPAAPAKVAPVTPAAPAARTIDVVRGEVAALKSETQKLKAMPIRTEAERAKVGKRLEEINARYGALQNELRAMEGKVSAPKVAETPIEKRAPKKEPTGISDEEAAILKDMGMLDEVTTAPAKDTGRTHILRKAKVDQKAVVKGGKAAAAAKATPAVKMVAGSFLGFDTDEDGNLTFDPVLAAEGSLGLSVGMMLIPKFRLGAPTYQAALARSANLRALDGMIGKESSTFAPMGWVKYLHEKLFNRINALKVSLQGYEAARSYQSHKDVSWLKFLELKDIINPIKNTKDAEEIFSKYVLAYRALSRSNTADRARTLYQQLVNTSMTGMTQAQRKAHKAAVRNAFERSRITNPTNIPKANITGSIQDLEDLWVQNGGDLTALQTAFDESQAWMRKYILDEGVSSGVISQEARDAIVRDNEWYATFDVLDWMPENTKQGYAHLPIGEYFSLTGQKVVKAMKGTEKQIRDPLEATISKFTNAQAVYARNRVVTAFVEDPMMQNQIQRVARSPKEFAVMEAAGMNPIMEGAWSRKEFDTVARFKDGVVEKYLVSKDIADAMKSLTPWQAPWFLKASANVFRQAATTLYLPFSVTNMFRDSLMAFTTSPVYRTRDIIRYPYDWAKGAYHGAKFEFLGKDNMVEEYLRAGTGFGYSGEVSGAKASKRVLFKRNIDWINPFTSPGHMVQAASGMGAGATYGIEEGEGETKYNWAKGLTGMAVGAVGGKALFETIRRATGTIELAPRLAVFNRARDLGYTLADAAMAARSATIDFSKGGQWTKMTNQFVPFVNAKFGAWNVVYNAFKKDPVNTSMKVLTAVVMPAMGLYAWNRAHYSELYDDIPSYIRDNNFCFIYGTDVDEHMRTVPKLFALPKGDIGQLVVNPIELALDHEFANDPPKIGKWCVDWISDMSPIPFAVGGKVSGWKAAGGVMPPVAKGFLEQATGKSTYTGRDIVPISMQMQGTPPELQYTEKTPRTYVWAANTWIGRQIGMSPVKTQNFMQNLFAGYGREGLDPNAMLRSLTGRLTRSIGGGKEARAWEEIADIKKGYDSTKAWAKELMKQGKEAEADALIEEYNAGIEDRIAALQEISPEFEDQGSLLREYSFSQKKIKNIFEEEPETTLTPLQRRLGFEEE